MAYVHAMTKFFTKHKKQFLRETQHIILSESTKLAANRLSNP